MQPMFNSLMAIMANPVSANHGVRTDDSVLLIYPPNNELDFREQLLDGFVPALNARAIPCQLFDLTGFMFEGLSEQDIEELPGRRDRRLQMASSGSFQTRGNQPPESPAGNCRPESRWKRDRLCDRRCLPSGPLRRGPERSAGPELSNRPRIPGRGARGKLHFMNQPDGGNYLAVKLFWP